MRSRPIISKITSVLMIMALAISMIAAPMDVHAAAKKTKVKCTVKILNADSYTVIRKGKQLKLRVSAVSSNGRKVRLKYKSFNKRVATVSKKGVIKAKKKGTVKIKVYGYVSGKNRGSKTISIRVGTPVTKVGISGRSYLRAGRSDLLKVAVSPSNATNKKVIWSSSNPKAVSVDQKGKITGRGNGSAVIQAKAVDGSRVYSRKTVYSHRYTKSDTNWIAHRGLHDSVPENTEDAFRRAGEAGFWAAECDIWETKHVLTTIVTQQPAVEDSPETQAEQTAGEDTDAAGSVEKATETGETAETTDELIPETEPEIQAPEVTSGEEPQPETVEEKQTIVPEEVQEEEPGEPEAAETFDIVISHDSTFRRVFGVNANVKDTTAEEIRSNSKLAKVCFLGDYLDICKQYDMIPVIEIKDYYLSDEGIAMVCEMVHDRGLLESVQFISFYADVLERTQKYIINTYGVKPYTGYLIAGGDAAAEVNTAKEKDFTGVNIAFKALTPAIDAQCQSLGLKVCTWTYNNSISSDEALYRHIVSGKYNVYSATSDVRIY